MTRMQGWPWTKRIDRDLGISEPNTWPRISVVTPSYNQGSFIEETIRSVVLQGYPNLEYIIIDGGSSDNSIEIIKKYESYISFWVSEKDRGQSHAINKGFSKATGQVFAWLCSDDVYAPGALRRVGSVIGQGRATMVIGDAIITDGPNSLKGRLDRRRPKFDDIAYNVKTLAQPSVFWTDDLWRKCIGVDEDLYFLMDYDLWLKMLTKATNITFVDEVLSYERTQPNQKSNTDASRIAQFLDLRASIALRASGERGERPLTWLTKVLTYRLRECRWRPWRLARRGFHWQAFHKVLFGGITGLPPKSKVI